MAGCLLLIYKEKSERAFVQARRFVGRTKLRFGLEVRRRLVVCGAGQFLFGAEPIFFGGTMHITAADPIRMRQLGDLLVCDDARRYGRGGIQAGDAALTHSRQGFGNGRCAEFVMMAR